ncbi:hypothetical protein P7L78_19160 [Tistrella bauzanensis]|uniref:hypothetical protein n=1 Tax=Tistrella TaxID=171436 RepID=UPI0031F713B7
MQMSGNAGAGRVDIDVENLLVWVYRDQKADLVTGRMDDGRVMGWRGSSLGRIEAVANLGCRVDGRGAGWGAAGELHRDAAATHEVVETLDLGTQRVVIRHARAGTRPDWTAGGLRCRPVWRRTATGEVRPRVIYTATRKPSYCPIEIEPAPAILHDARMEWVTWRGALDRIARDLRAVDALLTRHRITGPAADATPWLAP